MAMFPPKWWAKHTLSHTHTHTVILVNVCVWLQGECEIVKWMNATLIKFKFQTQSRYLLLYYCCCLYSPRSVHGSWPPWCARSAHRDTPGGDGQTPHLRCWWVCPPLPPPVAPSRPWNTHSPASPRHTHKCRPGAEREPPLPHLRWVLQ